YGAQYVEGGFILSILAIYYGILSLSNPVGSLQIAYGRTDLGFYWTIYRLTSTLIVVYIASFYNIETLVLLFLFLAFVNTIALWRFQIFIMLHMSFKVYISAIWKPFLLVLMISIPLFLMLWSSVSLLFALVFFVISVT